MPDFYKVKVFMLMGIKKVVYSSHHANHVSLYMWGKDFRKYMIYKNDKVIFFPSDFKFSVDELESYLENWKNEPDINDENPTGL